MIIDKNILNFANYLIMKSCCTLANEYKSLTLFTVHLSFSWSSLVQLAYTCYTKNNGDFQYKHEDLCCKFNHFMTSQYVWFMSN